MPAKGKRKGWVLISYITEPFTLAPWERFSNFHTMYWECHEIARLLSERGYGIDIIQAGVRFKPKKKYSAFFYNEIPVGHILEKLPKETKKIFRVLVPYWKAYNDAETSRLSSLKERRGIVLTPRRRVPESRNVEAADFLEGFGNRSIFNTFAHINKPVHHTYISAVETFSFPNNKNFAVARKKFLWIGGGGSVLKGLDLTLEAFAQTPELTLHVCGPARSEKDFYAAYKNELENTPNIVFHGRIDISGEEFRKVLTECAAVIYPTAAEGTSGAIVQAMHAGLVPVVTDEAGLDEESDYIRIERPTVESVREAALSFASRSEDSIERLARATWSYANTHYTRREFTRTFEEFLDNKLRLP